MRIIKGIEDFLKFAVSWVRFASSWMELFNYLLVLPKCSEYLMFSTSGWSWRRWEEDLISSLWMFLECVAIFCEAWWISCRCSWRLVYRQLWKLGLRLDIGVMVFKYIDSHASVRDICCCYIDVRNVIEVFNPWVICLTVTEITVNILRYTQAHVHIWDSFSLAMSKTFYGLE